jgi:phosphotriesterase-related protein
MDKRVVTVLGEVDPAGLGLVLPHEHLLWDLRCWAREAPLELSERARVEEPVRLENRGHVVYHPFHYLDNLLQTDVEVATEELRAFKFAGGGTVCDVTPRMLGRDPAALRRISLASGVHVVMGSAFYVAGSWGEKEKGLSTEAIRDSILEEFCAGVSCGPGGDGTSGGYSISASASGTGQDPASGPGASSFKTGSLRVKPGILGEIGVSDIENPLERKSLAASGMAQRELGCPLSVHTPIWEKAGNAILDILEKTGADLGKVALCHLDPTMGDAGYADSLAKRGAYIEYDLFDTHIMSFEGAFLPSDNERIAAVTEQIRRGNLERILLSQDTCMKIKLTRWGGHGYAHILENIVPRFLREGLAEAQVDAMLRKNPARFLSW